MAWDDVGLFGLDEFGDPVGLSPIYGAMVGVGAGTLGAIAARQLGATGATAKYSEAIGLGIGVAAGAAMVAFPSTRHAGWVAIAAAVLNNGLRAIEDYMATKGIFAGAGVGFPVLQNRKRGISGPDLLGYETNMRRMGPSKAHPHAQTAMGPPQAAVNVGYAQKYGTSPSVGFGQRSN